MSTVRAAALIGLMLVAGPATAQEAKLRLTPQDIDRIEVVPSAAGTSGVAGIETRVLAGDPAKAAPYTISIRVPPNTRIAAHTHRDDRSAIVSAGVWYFGYGPAATDADTKPLPPGSYYTEPAGVLHFARTGPEGATVHISGFGPTDTQFFATSPTSE